MDHPRAVAGALPEPVTTTVAPLLRSLVPGVSLASLRTLHRHT